MKKFLVIVGFLFFLLYPIKADAQICTSAEYDKALKDAYNVKITHELGFEDGLWYEPYYELTISNMTKNIQILYNNVFYEYGMDKEHPDSIIVSTFASLDSTASFSIYPVDGSPCMGYVIHTINHNLPYFNVYINTDECVAYPKFSLCARDYRGNADADEFLVELENYIAQTGVKPVEPKEEKEEKKGVFESIIDFYLENKIISIPLTIIFISCIVILANRHISQKKKRAKYKVKI